MKSETVFIFNLINFAILITLLFYFLKKITRQFLYARKLTIKKEAIKAAKTLRQARLHLINSKLSTQKLPDEINVRSKMISKRCEDECEKIINAANGRASHIIETAIKQGQEEKRLALLEIKKKMILSAFTKAKRVVKEKMTSDLQETIIKNGISEIIPLVSKDAS